MPPIKAVLDTNVIISGLCFSGPPHRIINLAIEGKIEVLTTPALAEELRRVLFLKFSDRSAEIAETLSEFALLWTVIPAQKLPKVSVIRQDPADNIVLACAAAGKANIIVSGDAHLLGIKVFRSIPIVTPRVFFESFSDL